MIANDDIRGLDIPVQHTPAVGIVDGVADVEEPPQDLPQLERPAAGVGLDRIVVVERGDRLLEAVPLDEPHRVVRPAAVVGAQAVDGHDARVLEAAGDLGLDEEPLAADRVVGVMVEDLLERHLAVQLAIEGHEDGPQGASGMGPEDVEPLDFERGRSNRRVCSAVGVIVIVGRAQRRADVPEGRLNVRAAGAHEAFASGPSDRKDRKALLNVAAKGLDMHTGDGLDSSARRGASRWPSRDKVVGQGIRPLSRVHAANAVKQRPWSIKPF